MAYLMTLPSVSINLKCVADNAVQVSEYDLTIVIQYLRHIFDNDSRRTWLNSVYGQNTLLQSNSIYISF